MSLVNMLEAPERRRFVREQGGATPSTGGATSIEKDRQFLDKPDGGWYGFSEKRQTTSPTTRGSRPQARTTIVTPSRLLLFGGRSGLNGPAAEQGRIASRRLTGFGAQPFEKARSAPKPRRPRRPRGEPEIEGGLRRVPTNRKWRRKSLKSFESDSPKTTHRLAVAGKKDRSGPSSISRPERLLRKDDVAKPKPTSQRAQFFRDRIHGV